MAGVDAITGWSWRSRVTFPVSPVDRPRRGEEAKIGWRVHVDEVDDRDDLAWAQLTYRPIGLRGWHDPVIGRRRDNCVRAGRRDYQFLEITDAHTKAIRPKVRSQFGGHHGTDLDDVNGCFSGEKILRRVAGPGTDLHDLRLRRQRLEECVEELGWI
jgi:hypothetical protein